MVFQAKNSIPEIKRSKVTDEKLKAEREKRERTYDQRIQLFKEQVHQHRRTLTTTPTAGLHRTQKISVGKKIQKKLTPIDVTSNEEAPQPNREEPQQS